MNTGVLLTPNKAIRESRGGLSLKGRPILVNRALGLWKYQDNNIIIPEEEFWHPQKATQPPDRSVFHHLTKTGYFRKYKVWFEERYDHWVTAAPELQYVEDATFQGPYYISGKESDNLPRELCEVSPLAIPCTKSTPANSRGTYRVIESESESESSDKEPVQQLEDSSNPVSKSV